MKSLVLLFAATALPLAAQEAPSLDGPGRLFEDAWFDALAGQWVMTGTVAKEPVTYAVRVEWVLHHQFLRLDMRDTTTPPAYEAHVYIGRDNTSERYVAHWLDVFGGRWSETLGYGRRDSAGTVEFVFEYPDGPFRTAFTRDTGSDTWHVVMRQRDASGTWGVFADATLRRP